MDPKDLKKALAGLCITGLLAGSSLSLLPGDAQASSG
jgi:radical SAM modification target selenobiotic family peptide